MSLPGGLRKSKRSTARNCCMISGSSLAQSGLPRARRILGLAQAERFESKGCAGVPRTPAPSRSRRAPRRLFPNPWSPVPSQSPGPREIRDDVPAEAHELRRLEQPLPIAVRRSPLVHPRSRRPGCDAEALHALHEVAPAMVAGAHRRQRRCVVDARACRLVSCRSRVELRVSPAG